MFRRTGVLSLLALTVFLCCGFATPVGCETTQIGPSEGEVIGIGIAAIAVVTIGTVVLVEVHKGHHTVKGCVFSGPNGLEVQTSDQHIYALSGDTLKVKEGEMVQVHGDKMKRAKNGSGDSAGDQTFVVEKLNKSYGSCALSSGTGAAPASGAAPAQAKP